MRGLVGFSIDPFVCNASLFEDDICQVTRTDVRIDRKLALIDWAIPDFVIALAGPVVCALMTSKNRLNARRVTCHYAACGS
jgi:hypothetical protein